MAMLQLIQGYQSRQGRPSSGLADHACLDLSLLQTAAWTFMAVKEDL